MIFVAIVFYLGDTVSLQLMLNVALTQGVLMYNVQCKSFRDSEVNAHEFANDVVVLLFGYLCMCVSDWIPDASTKILVG